MYPYNIKQNKTFCRITCTISVMIECYVHSDKKVLKCSKVHVVYF